MTTHTFMGMTIDGEITLRHSQAVVQRSKEELAILFGAVLDRSEIVGVRWMQYTPYFNDGDVCEFGVCEPYVALSAEYLEDIDVSDREDDSSDTEYDGKPLAWLSHYDNAYAHVMGGTVYTIAGPNGQYSRTVIKGKAPVSLRVAWSALSEALQSGEFNNVLLEMFGDHAEVTVIKGQSISVQSYDHE